MSTLSEAESKRLLASYGLPVLDERDVADVDAAVAAARAIGFPCVVKLCGDQIAHKTERNLVRLGLTDEAQVRAAGDELLAAATEADGPVRLLVAPMIRATREFIVGGNRTDQFGAVVMLGIGGVMAEAMGDVSFRLAPLRDGDADDMFADLDTQPIFSEFRGEPPVDRVALARVVDAVASALAARPDIESIDVNPVLIADGVPVAVDALVVLR